MNEDGKPESGEQNHLQIQNSGVPRIKLVVVGDGACGKTSLLTVFAVSTMEAYLGISDR